MKFIDDIEILFKDLLLTDITFAINSKIIKRGRLLNLSIKDFFVYFQLEVAKGGIKLFEIPYPFNIIQDNDQKIIFDYRLNTLVFEDVLNLLKIKKFKPKKNCKFYDVEVVIKKHI